MKFDFVHYCAIRIIHSGTSTDVSRFAGQYEHVFETATAGVTIQAPQVVHVHYDTLYM